MATYSNFLGLILPGFEEYTDSWWEPLNGNFTSIDTSINGISAEIVAARQSKTSLLAFLEVGHNSDGTLQAAPEVIRARVSPVYGFLDAGLSPLPLKSRMDSLDYELYLARRGQISLLAGLAFSSPGLKNMVLAGTADGGGAPAWLGFTGANARLDGTANVLYLLIDGYTCHVRTLRTIVVSGAAGVHYLKASFTPGGVVTLDGTLLLNGQTSLDSDGFMTLFTDSAANFSVSDVQAGDLLTLTTSADKGQYVISEVAPGGIVTQLKIIGSFPTGGLSSIGYTVTDPLGVTLSQATSSAEAAGTAIIGEADFDGAAITAVRARQFKDVYNSPWRFFDLSSTSSQEEIFSHLLGDDVLDVQVQVSQANDGTAPVEMLSIADLTQDTALTIIDGKTVSVANTLTFSPGTGDATLTGGAVALSAAVTASLGGTISGTAGAVKMARSVACKWDRNRLYVKNVTPSTLYKDYSGAQHQTGYVRVVVRKRG